MAAVGRRCVNGAATQGQRCRQRLSGALLPPGGHPRKRSGLRSSV